MNIQLNKKEYYFLTSTLQTQLWFMKNQNRFNMFDEDINLCNEILEKIIENTNGNERINLQNMAINGYTT